MDKNELGKANNTKKLLDSISPSFCTVKWKHATVNLGSGTVKSCCHLPFRKIESDKAQFHDTTQDQIERSEMLAGKKPSSCAYCWWTEQKGHLSDRIVWSSKSWMSEFTTVVANKKSEVAEPPSWVELNFSNLCNLKCSYCSPIFSTKWHQEIKTHGPYLTTPAHNSLKYLTENGFDPDYENSETLEKFWKWFNFQYSNLKLLKITGGEPFLSSQTEKLLNFVLENKNENLNFSINSNLTIPENTWEKYVDRIVAIIDKKSVQKFYLHPSIDCFGKRSEYIRFGLDFNLFQKNVHTYLSKGAGNLVFICTINNLSLGGLKEFWAFLLSLKKQYGAKGQWVSVTSEVLLSPEWQNINILPESFQSYITETIEYVEANLGSNLTSFSEFELMGLKRALDMMRIPNENLNTSRKNFYTFFSEHDRRRGTHFNETFPELIHFFNECRTL